MKFSWIPKDQNFFELFAQLSSKVLEGARLLWDLFEHYDDVEKKTRMIKEVEHQADGITHEIFHRLNKTFVTPFDREDIHQLASCLDDILDDIEGVSARMVMFHISKPTAEAVELVDIVRKAVEQIDKAVANLKTLNNLIPFVIEINRMENMADEITRKMVGKLFQEEKNVIELLKWKEIYGRLESTADKCEDVANIIENIVVKNA